MATTARLIRARDFLQIEGEGNINFIESKKILKKIVLSNKTIVKHDILIDFRRVHWCISPSETYQLVSDVIRLDVDRSRKIAILTTPGFSFDSAEFFETCAINRGYTVENFTNFEDAIYWLHKKIEILDGNEVTPQVSGK